MIAKNFYFVNLALILAFKKRGIYGIFSLMNNLTYQAENKERLDKYLAGELSGWSRSKIQKLIGEQKVKVNGRVVSAHYQLKNGDEIQVEQGLETENATADLPAKPKVLADEKDYLVINKPSGLIVHPAKGIKEKTLADWLKENYPGMEQIGEDLERPGIVHRLDKEVSGLMVVAKTQPMFESLKDQFKNHTVRKEYLGLVQGRMEQDVGVIDFPLKRSTVSGKIVSGAKGEEGRESKTEFEVLKRFVNYTFLKLNLKTGRSHQIRAHLQAYGYPLVGDQLYKNRKVKEKIELNRVFLHSHKLEFDDLEGERRKFELKLPDKLNKILEELK